jgi:hypothetical protein
MKKLNIVTILLVLMQSNFSMAIENLVFVDTSCKMLGTMEGKDAVSTTDGDPVYLNCEVTQAKLNCGVHDLITQKEINKIKFKATETLKNDAVLFINTEANISMIVNMKNEEYRLSQTTVLSDKGIVLNKNCYGRIKTEKSFNEKMKKIKKDLEKSK